MRQRARRVCERGEGDCTNVSALKAGNNCRAKNLTFERQREREKEREIEMCLYISENRTLTDDISELLIWIKCNRYICTERDT